MTWDRLRRSSRRSLLPIVASITWAEAASSQTSAVAEPNRDRAAALYDRAVQSFERRDYREAALGFLAADEIATSTDAVLNAIASARNARDPLLLATAAERGVAREQSAPALAGRARAALEEADRQLGVLLLSCRPEPCEIDLDGQRMTAGQVRVLPGAHAVGVRAQGGERSARTLEVAAGAKRELRLDAPPPAGRPPKVLPPNEARTATPPAAASPASDRAPRAEPAFVKPLFYAGLGTTVALVAATTWSGIDTLRARSELPGTQEENEAVLASAHRTDALLAGTVLIGAATAYVGIRFLWLERREEPVTISAAALPGGGFLSIRGAH